MPTVRIHRETDLPADRLSPRNRGLVGWVRESGRPALGITECRGDVVGLGRFHVVPDVAPAARVSLHRRHGGGRPVPLGNGFVAVALALPDVATLADAGATPLAPEQTLNRAVRGLLGALEALGVEGYYPGRDVVTVGGRTIGALTLDVAEDGLVLVELVLSVARSFAEITRHLDRADPTGVVPADVVLPEQATSVAAERGAPVSFDAIADALREGYARRLGLEAAAWSEPPPAVDDPGWLAAGRLPAALDRHASIAVMLGRLAAHAALADGRIADVRVTGDFLASAATVARIEARCRGLAPERATIVDAVRGALVGPRDFVLGVRPLERIADVILAACGAA